MLVYTVVFSALGVLSGLAGIFGVRKNRPGLVLVFATNAFLTALGPLVLAVYATVVVVQSDDTDRSEDSGFGKDFAVASLLFVV